METINVQRSQNQLQSKLYNWKMSFNVIDTGQQNIVFSQKSSFTFCTCRYQLPNARLTDITLLKECTCSVKTGAKREIRISDADSEEYETQLDHSDSMLDPTKVKVWDEYKKLLLSKSTYRPQKDLQSLLTEITCYRKIRVDKPLLRSHLRPNAAVQRSIIRIELQKTILVANSNYIQFRNFKLHKLYKKTIRLQNITTSPAKFKIQGRPYRSYFQILIKPIVENSSIIPPGMVMKLIVSFYCNVIDEPEEILVLNVQDGKPVTIRLHGFRDPPILLERNLSYEEFDNARSIRRSSIASHPELGRYSDEAESTEGTVTSTDDSEDGTHATFRTESFDCKKSFVGEEVRVPMKFKNIGGEGRFFVMSEIDWSSMYIEDVTEENLLKIPPFAIWPAHFELKSEEEITLCMYFLPDSYGIHVDKLYVLGNNCTMLTTEIIGDGVLYEPNFIQLSKVSTSSLRNSTVDIVQLEKNWPPNEHNDKRARYYVNLKASVLDGIGQCTVCASNVSEISMRFRWKKRATRVDETDGKNYADLPLNLLEVDPDHGFLSPVSAHYFNVTAKCKDLRFNLYSAVLRLYIEDIPLAAISQELELHTEACTNRQRKALSSVDVWVADIEVRLQCDIDNESKIDTEVSESFESFVESASSYEYCVWDEEDAGEVFRETTKNCCLCKLMPEELFSHYDMINLKQFEPLLWEHIISVAIIRPTRSLYIGIGETYVLLARNFSDKSVKFSWGEANGADAEKLKVCVCPQNGVVAARNTKKMKITVLPVKEGVIQFLHIPCFIDDTRKIIMLTIECSIEPLHVAFYFPQNDREVFQWKTSFARVEWRVDSWRMAFDMAEESKEGMKLLDKYKMREEKELMNMNLDQGDVLKDASVGTSASNVGAVNSGVEFSLSTRTSEIIKQFEGNYAEENESSGHMVPFSETTSPSQTEPVVIKFLNVSLRKVEKKTFIIKNQTAIPTNFWISVKNFYPVQCSCETRIIEDRIKFMFKQAFGKNKNIIEESLYRVKQPDSGIIIHVDPLRFDLDPYAAVPVDIYVFADTWGIYVDELEISITGLPRYTLEICVQVVGLPISLSIAQNSSTTVPVLNYGLEPMGNRLPSRKVLVKNTSVVPIAIDWHVFLIKPVMTEKIPPINIVYDICTPFTNELSKELKDCRFRTKTDKPIENHVTDEGKSKISNAHDPISSGDSVTDLLSTSSDISNRRRRKASDQRCVKTEAISTWPLHNEDSEKAERSTMSTIQRILTYLRCRQVYRKDDTSLYIDTEQNDTEKKEDVECRISVLPYYGEAKNIYCTVAPKEMFTIPNHSDAINISIHPDKCVSDGNFEGEFVCKVLGLLRIAPSDKYLDNRYCRLDGLYLSPIEFDVAVTVVRPLLLYDIPKADKTFICCINDVMRTKLKKLELSKSFFFYNNKGTAMNVILETYYPFHVKSTSIFTECNPYIPMVGVSINGHGCAEVEIICKVDNELIHTILHTSKAQELRSSVITLREPLFILYPDNSSQEVELNLQIWIPSLKLSTYALDFSTVYVNETKKLQLVLENLSMSVYQFKVNGKYNNKDFAVDQNEGKLLSKHVGSCYCTLTISFRPKKPGQSVETLEIITDAPYNVDECELLGEGTLDEKFHNPGV